MITREQAIEFVYQVHDQRRANHLKSVNNFCDWMDKHTVTQKDGLRVVSIDDVEAAIIFQDLRLGATLTLQPMKSTGDIGQGPGATLTLNF